MKDNNDDKNNIKELLKTPRGKAILFFGAYLVFFIIIGIMARVGPSSIGTKYEVGNSQEFSLTLIEQGNYVFSYEVVIDDLKYTYQGSRMPDKEMVQVNNLEKYYGNLLDNIYFIEQNGLWINAKKPYVFEEFIDVKNIGSLIENAYYVSKTEYESGTSVYNFMLSSATLTKVFENGDLDIDEVPNDLTIFSNKDGYANEIIYKLDSYCKVKEICKNNMMVTLKYENFGEVSISSPLE